MKMYLLAGGLLITAASVYGIADYMKTKNKKEFQELYKETPSISEKEVKHSAVKEAHFSRGNPEIVSTPLEEKNELQKPNIELTPVPVNIKKEKSSPENVLNKRFPKQKTHRKKVNLKLFSRAAPVIRELPVTDSSENKKH